MPGQRKRAERNTWNHRVIRHVGRGIGKGDDALIIHEVHYTNGRPKAVTVDGTAVVSETVAGLRVVLRQMARALRAPILEYDGFKRGGYRAPKKRKRG